jgi:ribonucleoside-diphosphate reductase beta chain
LPRKVEKRIINGSSDVNQLMPMTHKWAYEAYQLQSQNHWLPQEITMARDIADWKDPNKLSEDERLLVKRNLGFFTTADSLAANNIVLGTYRHITSPEYRMFLLLQAREEVIHTDAYAYIVESLGLDQEEIFAAYIHVPSIRAKDEFLLSFIETLTDPHFKTGTLENDQKFLKALIAFAVVMEGLFFYCGFVQMLALGRQNKMAGASEQYQYIMRDETSHCLAGIDAINTIKQEQPEVWTDAFKEEIVELIKKGVDLEIAYAVDTMPNGVLGLNVDLFSRYIRNIANRRAEQIGLGTLYKTDCDNPFPWMSEMTDLRKEKNFFETRVIDYSVGALSWD